MSFPGMIGGAAPIWTSGNRVTSSWPLYVPSNKKLWLCLKSPLIPYSLVTSYEYETNNRLPVQSYGYLVWSVPSQRIWEITSRNNMCIKVRIVFFSFFFVSKGKWTGLHQPFSFKQPCAETIQEGGGVSTPEPRGSSQSLHSQYPPSRDVHPSRTQSATQGRHYAGPLIWFSFISPLRLLRWYPRHSSADVHSCAPELRSEVAQTDAKDYVRECRFSKKWRLSQDS